MMDWIIATVGAGIAVGLGLLLAQLFITGSWF